jgi:hypothetical protein
MLCTADSGWPLAYFQVAVSILIFGIGLPSLVLQAFVPDDIREVVRHHFWLLRWGYIFYIPLMMLVVMFFVWIIHPCDANPQLRFLTGFLAGIGFKYDFSQWDEVIITLSVVGLSSVWFLQVWYRRDKLLNSLKGKCERRIRRDGFLDEQVLDDIRYLGEQGKTRGFKIRILEIFERLAFKVQAQERYQGSELEDIVRAIELSLQKDTDAASFTQGILTLKHILEREPTSRVDSSADVGAILRAVQRLGDVAITMDNERPARMILETVEFVSRSPDGAYSKSTLALYELGTAALANGHFLIAVETLDKLDTMIHRIEPVDAVHSSAYLGLIAHFWARKGSARKHALSSLRSIKFSPSRTKCLISAQRFYFRTARFTTADILSKMMLLCK